MLTGIQLGKGDLAAPHRLGMDDAPSRLEPKFHRIRQTRPVARQHKTIHHHVNVVALLLVQLGQLVHRIGCPVNAHTRETLPLDLGERLLVTTFLTLHDRSVEDEL